MDALFGVHPGDMAELRRKDELIQYGMVPLDAQC